MAPMNIWILRLIGFALLVGMSSALTFILWAATVGSKGNWFRR